MAATEIMGRAGGTAVGRLGQGEQWFAVRAVIGQEKLADDELAIVEGVIPLLPVVRHRTVSRGARKTVERPLFEGYLFALFDPWRIDWAAFNRARGVVGLVCTPTKKILTVPESEIKRVCKLEGDSRLVDPKIEMMVKAGEFWRVTRGPFTSFNGQVTSVRILKGVPRATIDLSIFGRATPIEIDQADLERA